MPAQLITIGEISRRTGLAVSAIRFYEEKGFIERPEHMQAFFAKGKAGGWREDLTPAQVARLREAFLPTIMKWYPELVDVTEEVARRA